MCSQSPRPLPRLYLSERSESPRERGFHDRRTILSPASCKARKKPLRSLTHSSSCIGVIKHSGRRHVGPIPQGSNQPKPFTAEIKTEKAVYFKPCLLCLTNTCSSTLCRD